jgi:hypothetical protein
MISFVVAPKDSVCSMHIWRWPDKLQESFYFRRTLVRWRRSATLRHSRKRSLKAAFISR